MKRTALVVAMGLLAVPALAEMDYEEFMGGVGAAQQQIDYSGRLVKRSELDKWILESGKSGDPTGEGNGEGGGASEGEQPEVWLPDAMKPDDEQAGDPPAETEKSADPVEAAPAEPSPPAPAQQRPRGAVGENEGDGAIEAGGRQGGGRAADGTGGETAYRGKKAGVSYVFLPDVDTEVAGTTFQMKRTGAGKTIRYGIPIGTRFRVELRSGASSVQPGLVQVVLLEDVIGNKKTLERGAVLFMEVTAERGSERLFGTAVRGIERNRRDEFTLSGNIYGHDGQPGLIARVISDGRGVDRATDVGLAALGEAAISAIPGTNMGVDASKRAGSSLLGDADNKNQTARGMQKLVVQAEPQNAVIEIGETF